MILERLKVLFKVKLITLILRLLDQKQCHGNSIKKKCFNIPVIVQFLLLGWYEGERLRDGERGWFLAECAEPITCQASIERNMQRMDRLQGLETNV